MLAWGKLGDETKQDRVGYTARDSNRSESWLHRIENVHGVGNLPPLFFGFCHVNIMLQIHIPLKHLFENVPHLAHASFKMAIRLVFQNFTI